MTIIGHEWCGEIVGFGEGVTDPPLGSFVVGEGIVPCNECFECLSTCTNRCLQYDEFGFTRDGAASQFIIVPIELIHGLEL